jgi:hypothetical protein
MRGPRTFNPSTMRHVELSVVPIQPLHERAWTLPADLAARIAALPVRPTHHRAVARTISAAFSEVPFRLRHVYPGRVYRPGRLLDSAGQEIALHALKWITAKLAEVQQGTPNFHSWRPWYEALRASGVVRTAYRITPLYFAGRCGSGAADWWQALVNVEQEYPGPELPSIDEPDELDCYSGGPEESQPPIGAPVYHLQHVQHIGAFVERAAALRRAEHPQILQRALERPVSVAELTPDGGVVNYLTSEAEVFGLTAHPGLSHLQRWFQDWSESSARNTPVELHWRFELSEGGGLPNSGLSGTPLPKWQDKRYCDATPQWATRKALARSSKARIHNDAELLAWMERFDARAGHPMAWYFFMLHGNRITHHFGERVLDAIERGALLLPDRDNAVLQRWGTRPYGF